MSDEQNEKGYLVEGTEDSLTFNMKQEAFADILLNFLGKKESLEYFNAKDVFKVTIPDLLQLDASFKQKIDKEQFTKVDNLNVTIEYDNLTSHNFNGIDKLATYDSFDDALPIVITLTWDIVISIPGTQRIEKQQVNLSFNSFSMSNEQREVPFHSKNGLDSFIRLEVEFTNQAWGMEVLNLFKSKISKLQRKEKNTLKTMNFFDRVFLRESFLVFVIMMTFLYHLVTTVESGEKKSEVQISTLAKVTKIYQSDEIKFYDYNLALIIIDKKNNDLDILKSIHSKDIRNILEEYIKTVTKKDFKYNMLIQGLYIILIFVLLKIYVRQTRRFYETISFILVTTESKKLYEDNYSQKGYWQYFSVVGIIMAVIASLIAAYIYDVFIN